RTCWCPRPWRATAAEPSRPKIRDGQIFFHRDDEGRTGLDKYDPNKGTLCTYIASLPGRRLRRAYHKRRKRKEAEQIYGEQQRGRTTQKPDPTCPDLVEDDVSVFEHPRVEEWMVTLCLRDQQLLELRAAGYTQQEIAGVRSCAVATVCKDLKRLEKSFRDFLQ